MVEDPRLDRCKFQACKYEKPNSIGCGSIVVGFVLCIVAIYGGLYAATQIPQKILHTITFQPHEEVNDAPSDQLVRITEQQGEMRVGIDTNRETLQAVVDSLSAVKSKLEEVATRPATGPAMSSIESPSPSSSRSKSGTHPSRVPPF